MASTTLAVPVSSSSALALTVFPPNSGLEKLDTRFAAILTQNDVDPDHMEKLGNAGVKSTALFGYIAKTQDKLDTFLKRTLNLDADANPLDAIPLAKLTIVWETCRRRTEVETEAAVQRSVNHLPPQLTVEDHSTARDALERRLGRKIPDHKIPSENYFESKVGEAETVFKAEKLSMVTNMAQEDRQRTPHQAVGSQSITFDNRGQPTLKTSRKEFFVPMPNDEASLRNRFEVMGACLMMLKMRFLNNYALSTITPELMREYADYLCGERVWGYVVKDESGMPVSCPSLPRVLGYEQSMRDLAWKLVKSSGYTFKGGLEAAMADADTRILNFTTGFSMEANSAACRRLTAPGLQEIYASLPRQVVDPPSGTKRPDPPAGAAAPAKKKSKQQKRTEARAQLAIKDGGVGAAPPGPPPAAKKGDAKGGKGGKGGKGEGKAKTSTLPANVKRQTASGKHICFSFNKKERCVQEPCTFEHACWWCEGAHPGNDCRATGNSGR